MDKDKPPSLEKLGNDVARYLKEKQVKENEMKELQKYNKFWVAAIGALLSLFITMYPTSDISQYANMVLAVMTALGVYVIPNKPLNGGK